MEIAVNWWKRKSADNLQAYIQIVFTPLNLAKGTFPLYFLLSGNKQRQQIVLPNKILKCFPGIITSFTYRQS